MSKSSRGRASNKARKPHPDFPLCRHQSGRWAKKIRQRFHYFGKVTDSGDHGAQAALERWLAVKDDLLAGRTPALKGEGTTVVELVNRYLTHKKALVVSGSSERRTRSRLDAAGQRDGPTPGFRPAALLPSPRTGDEVQYQPSRPFLAPTARPVTCLAAWTCGCYSVHK